MIILKFKSVRDFIRRKLRGMLESCDIIMDKDVNYLIMTRGRFEDIKQEAITE